MPTGSTYSLIEWLQHSRKKYCELCNHAFAFHKRYKGTTPSGRLPSIYYFRRLLRRTLDWVLYGLRAVLCAVVWLVFLPLVNIFTLRGLFWIADVLLWGLGRGPRPSGFADEAAPAVIKGAATLTSATASAVQASATAAAAAAAGDFKNGTGSPLVFLGLDVEAIASAISAASTAYEQLSPDGVAHVPIKSVVYAIGGELHRQYAPMLRSLAKDCFEGQVLSCAIVVAFVGISLLQEWVLQHVPQAPEVVVPPAEHAEAEEQAQRAPAQPPVLPGQMEAEQRAQVQQQAAQGREILRRLMEEAQEARERRMQEQGGGGGAAAAAPHTQQAAPQPREALPPLMEAETSTEAEAPASYDASWLTEARETGARHTWARDTAPAETDEHETQREGWIGRRVPNLERAEENVTAPTESEPGNAHEAEAPAPTGEGAARGWMQDLAPIVFAGEDDSVMDASMTADDGWEDVSDEGDRLQDEEAAQNGDRANPRGGANAHGHGHGRRNVQARWRRRILNFDGVQGIQLAEEVPLDADPVDDDQNDDEAAMLDGWDEAEEAAAFQDEVAGVLEAIGLHGAIVGLPQNLALFTVISSLAICVFLTLPYFLGRVLGTGEPILRIVSFPIELLRGFTDPFFDAIIHLAQQAFQYAFNGAATKSASSSILSSAASQASNASAHSSGLLSTASTTASAYTARTHDAAISGFSEAHAWLQARIYGQSTSDKVFSILLGHFYWVFGINAHSRFSAHFNVGAPSWWQTFIVQQLTILKVGAFIGIELVAFPLACGFLLDLCTLPLAIDTTLQARLAAVSAAPVTVLFAHWVLGTLYMFLFAQFVSLTREIARPGVLCWIRDPNDPDFEPIKEIVERRSTTHLAKIGTSVLMYGGVLLANIGLPCAIIRGAHIALSRSGLPSLLPLQTEVHLSGPAIAVDLVGIIVTVPWLVRKARPSRMMRRLYTRWWRFAAAKMRLTSFLRGGRHPAEEGVAAPASLKRKDQPEQSLPATGSFARVPADNNAVMSAPLVVRTDAHGTPLTEEGMKAVTAQHEAIAKMTTKKAKYTIVYLPPHFRARLWGFVGLLWLSVASLITIGIALPITVGRMLSPPFTGSPVHDGHAAFVGGCICFAALGTARGVFKVVKGVNQSVNNDDTTSELLVVEHDRSSVARLALEAVGWVQQVVFQRIIMALCFGLAFQFCEFLRLQALADHR